MIPLPIATVLEDLKAVLRERPGAVLLAPPGSGKTTRVPLALLDEPWLADRRIVMLEPRRLAARAAAAYMAGLLGEPVGRTVGYRVRMDTAVGPRTRIEVVTEGVLTRLMQSDASLAGTGLLIFDEFHERHLEADLGLALCLDLQGVLNPDLKLLVMSATMETGSVAAVLGAAPVVACEGRLFEVETRYAGRRGDQPIEREVAAAVLAAAEDEAGSILVFLPGAPEIRRVRALLQASRLGPEWVLVSLFGNLTREEQDRAIAPAPAGRRKIVLATNIAETSLTIEGIRVVVDSGFARVPRFDVRSGMTRLVTLPVSRESADQRRGRAGRMGPGVCIRLWSKEAHGSLLPRNTPEILQADLAALALELAVWGVDSPGRLRWLDPPPAAAFDQGRQLLSEVGALDGAGAVTRHGRRMAELPMHPRLAHMVLAALDAGAGGAACDLAALLSERDFVPFASGEQDSDLRLRLEIMHDLRGGKRLEASHRFVDRAACRRVIRLAEALRRRVGVPAQDAVRIETGRLLAWAYPDRIGQRRAGAADRYLLTNGRGAFFAAPEPLSTSDYIVAADLDGERREARIFLAAAYDLATLLEQYAGQVHTREILDWDPRKQAVVAERELRLGALILTSEPLFSPDPAGIASALIKGIRRTGIDCLPWTRDARRWQARVIFLRRVGAGGTEWPDVSDATLTGSLEEWLGVHLSGITRLPDLKRVDLEAALAGILNWRQRRALDELAPTHLTVPSGSRIRLDYSGETPVLAVRIQEMFGGTDTPRVGGGSQPVLLHLLSPAGRPMQVSADLAGFWARGYPEVKKDLKGRYPKHSWPDDPLQAKPTTGRKKAQRR
ncbi:MAG TPA: ATP-dependent helicase HrpB [Desulfobacterales bacterium]|nr:ATP-dependent helicase HrpB [Desulfobacterales bacterium]